MNALDRRVFIDCYTKRYRQFAYDPRSLGWGKGGRQKIRFSALMGVCSARSGRVLDVGCGFGDLYGYLQEIGWNGKYIGVDIVPVLLDEARRQYPTIEVRNCDILHDPLEERFDYVIASGIFNRKLRGEAHDRYVEAMLARMFQLAEIAVAVDFMSTWVDFQQESAFHADPSQMLTLGMRHSRRAVLRHDYLPFEFCLYLYCRCQNSENSTYVASPEENG
jgi:SAM-dependent methyltransferase